MFWGVFKWELHLDVIEFNFIVSRFQKFDADSHFF